jgi:hypothetical protein
MVTVNVMSGELRGQSLFLGCRGIERAGARQTEERPLGTTDPVRATSPELSKIPGRWNSVYVWLRPAFDFFGAASCV